MKILVSIPPNTDQAGLPTFLVGYVWMMADYLLITSQMVNGVSTVTWISFTGRDNIIY